MKKETTEDHFNVIDHSEKKVLEIQIVYFNRPPSRLFILKLLMKLFVPQIKKKVNYLPLSGLRLIPHPGYFPLLELCTKKLIFNIVRNVNYQFIPLPDISEEKLYFSLVSQDTVIS